MLDKLKGDFDGILEMVNKCPPNLQEMALKTILEHWFTSNATPAPDPKGQSQAKKDSGSADAGVVPAGVKPFLTTSGITLEILGKAFHPIGPGAQLLASDIVGTGKSTKQVNLAILLAVGQALENGSFTCSLQQLREMALHYDCYDAANFAANLKSHKNYFKPRATGADLELSGPGFRKAGDLIKSIASVS